VLADGTIAAHSAERKRRHVPLKAAHVTNYTNHCAYRREIGRRCGFDSRFKIDARSPKPFDTRIWLNRAILDKGAAAAFGTSATSLGESGMSAFGGEAVVPQTSAEVRVGGKAEMLLTPN